VDAQRIPLAQMVVGEHDGYSDAVQARCGFRRFAVLAYLFAEAPPISAVTNEVDSPHGTEPEFEGLHFVPRAGDEPQRLAALLEQTYIGTLDCPELDGVRPMPEVLEGYRAQGRHWPGDWYFVQENGVDVGALILAEHPGFGNWELVYMGVISAARGRQCGDRIIRFALDVAARRGAERLVLAVDEANTPALRAYERAGFVAWDRRIVYARLRATA
jgi:mycothiol synthase